MMKSPLFVFALEAEATDKFADLHTLYTGVGKVNATYVLTQHLLTAPVKPSIVINCGTVGSRAFAPGSLLQCHDFVQRDMDVTALGFAPFQTPFSSDPAVINGGAVAWPELPMATCGTGDHFVTRWPDDAPYQLVDMEGFALALVCARLNVPFMSLKYVSDNADDSAHVDWGAALNRAASAMRTAVDQVLGQD